MYVCVAYFLLAFLSGSEQYTNGVGMYNYEPVISDQFEQVT